MFSTLFMKEIRESIMTSRFILVSLLCLMLIPLGMYVTGEDFHQRMNDYRQNMTMYQDRHKGNVYVTDTFEGYRVPSPLSVFALGLDPFIPGRVELKKDLDRSTGNIRFLDESGVTNPQSLLFGKIDFLFTSAFVLSLVALIFTFSSITGEKEMGTLRLIMTNAVPRWQILLAKITGNFLVFLAPFLVAVVAGILILSVSEGFALTSTATARVVAVILGATVLFLFSQFCLGVLVSTFHRSSLTAMISLLFIWVALTLAIPKASPMLAQLIAPVPSQEVFANRTMNAVRDLITELDGIERTLFEKVLGRHGYRGNEYWDVVMRENRLDERKRIEAEYDREIAPFLEDYDRRMARKVASLRDDYENRVQRQAVISMNLSRISPVSCYVYLVSDLAGTGVREAENFSTQAGRFREKIQSELYDLYVFKKYAIPKGTLKGGSQNMGFFKKPGYEKKNVTEVPVMSGYRFLSLREVMRTEWIDAALLALFTLLFFAGAFVRFLRYDVR